MVPLSNRSQKTPWLPLVCHFFCSYHNLTSSVIYYWTDAWQHWISLLNLQTDTVLFWLGVVLNCTFASFFNLRWDFILKKRKRGISFNTLIVAYPLLGQFELKAIEVSESCSLLLCGQFLGPGCLFPLFKDLSLLKGVLHWSTLSRGSNFDLEVSEGEVLEVKGLAAHIGTGPINQSLLKKIKVKILLIKFYFPRPRQFYLM